MNPFTKLRDHIMSLPSRQELEWKTDALSQQIQQINRTPQLAQNILFRTEMGVSSTRVCNEEVIVSLSTFGDRIHGTALTVETLLEQTVKPNRIILNLGRQFEGKGMIPGSLKLLERRGLEIRFSRDIGPYTKLLPTMRDFPNAVIITVDDDMLYGFDMVSRLVSEHIKAPADIVGFRCREMETRGEKFISPFLNWRYAPNDADPSLKLLPEGVYGILYPPRSLDERVYDEKLFMDLCPSADDFWFKAMSMLKGTLVRKAYADPETVRSTLSDPKTVINDMNKNGGYERQLKAVLQHFDLFKMLDKQQRAWFNPSPALSSIHSTWEG